MDLKINRLQVIDGDVTYVDQGPFKPLHVSRVNLNAENIRNIASQEHVYPSPIHLEAVVFDAGSVWLDGRADFLAEPHVGVQAALRLDQVALDYFKPITNRYNLAVRNGSLSLAGNIEYAPKITRLILERVLVHGVALEYLHLPHTAEAEKARAQQTAEAARQATSDEHRAPHRTPRGGEEHLRVHEPGREAGLPAAADRYQPHGRASRQPAAGAARPSRDSPASSWVAGRPA